jgi:hypothetical protein
MKSVQTQLVNVIREVAHPDIGVIAKVRSANESLFRSMTARAQQIDDLLGRLEKQVWVIWLSNEKLIHILKQQVPDRGRHNMRYFGLLSPRSKARTWAVLFALLGQKKGSHPRRLSWRWLRLKTFGTDPLQDSLGRPMHWVGRRTPVKAA